MAQPSTERACDRCRERRVKCDKRQPACYRCEKLGKPCPGYDKKRKFVDEGEVLRRKYRISDVEIAPAPGLSTDTSGEPSSAEPGIAAESGRPISPTLNSSVPRPWSGRSSNLSISHRLVETAIRGSIDAPLSGSSESSSRQPSSTNAAFAIPSLDPDTLVFSSPAWTGRPYANVDEVLNDTSYDPEWFNIHPDDFYSRGNNSCGFVPNLPNIVDEVDKQDFQSRQSLSNAQFSVFSDRSSNIWAPVSQLNTSAIITDEREHEMAYLIRHFTESIGPWMDLFDKDKHFGHLAPLRALRDALLRNAIAAVAAKQLGRVKGNKPFLAQQHQAPAAMEILDNTMEVDWFYKAANYYDKAITFSRAYLSALSGTLSGPSSPNTQLGLSTSTSDDLLVAVSIFSLYESLDNREFGWLQHLTGLKSLLSAVAGRRDDQLQPMQSLSVGRQASFWNFARADYQAAYLNHQSTLLDTEDLDLWRRCGLQLQDNGSLYANPTDIRNDSTQSRDRVQLVSHTMLWLVLRVVNYIAGDQTELPVARQAAWERLKAQLNNWLGSIPETFQPCAQVRYPLHSSSSRGTTSHLREVFFSIEQCAAALQLYHFARILLLVNKPSSGPAQSRLKAYREVSNEAIKHAREICGIALGRPHPAVRVEMLLPLYIAGTCLEANDERKVVLDLLEAIEKDTGCSTEVRVRSLIDDWGWNQEPEGLA